MTVDNAKVVAWFVGNIGKLTYSMTGSRNGTDGTADCSGSITQAVRDAGGTPYAYLYSTVTLGGYLKANGYERISVNQDWNAEMGDIILMSWGQNMDSSGGSGGHVMVMMNDTDVISTDYYTGGAPGTAVSIHQWDYYYNLNKPAYIEVWRNNGGTVEDAPQAPVSTPQPTEPVAPGAIQQFRWANDEFTIYKPIKVDVVGFANEIWQGVNYELAGGTDYDWTNNGIPLEIVDRVDADGVVTRYQEVAPGDFIKFQDDYNHGTIDMYDEASNGVGIHFGDLGMVWFNADALLKY